jgi:hypothetical protein
LRYANTTGISGGENEFSRRPIGSKNNGDKKQNKKQRGGFAFFGYFFGEAKSDLQPATRQMFI